MNPPQPAVPASSFAGLQTHLKSDALSGFLVFLIALPFGLAISAASGFPPVAGLLTAIIGGMVVSLVGGSELTIKGPAVGLIVVAAGAVEELGQGNALLGYQLALAAIVVAGVGQIIFGLLEAGALGDFFPAAVVRGVMAAIGLTIVLKELFVLTGTRPVAQEPLRLAGELPAALAHLNPAVFAIGGVSLLLLVGLPRIKSRYAHLVPAPVMVLLVAVPLARCFHLAPAFRVTLPGTLGAALVFPDFSRILTSTSIKYIVLFALVGSLESLLSTKAVDVLDPYRRRSNLNRDLLGVGVGNALAGLVGGLPMVSAIVRSAANVNNGAKTRWANFFHGLFMLICMAGAPTLLARIPLAALAAMLVYAGFGLAAPMGFVRVFRIGHEQLLVFLATIGATLATNLLLGIGAGILTEFVMHLCRGLSLRGVFKATVDVHRHDGGYMEVRVHETVVFSNYISLKASLEALPVGQQIVVDLSRTRLVDHTVLENLAYFQREYAATGGSLILIGLEQHHPVSAHPTATRVRPRRVGQLARV